MDTNKQSKGAAASGSNDTAALPAEEQQFETTQDIPAELIQKHQDANTDMNDQPDNGQKKTPRVTPDPAADLKELNEQTGNAVQ